jgi:hypothetical protein
MQHPDIHDILITIHDFLLLADDQTRCEIVPESFYFEDEYKNKQRTRGFYILRKLSSGWLRVKLVALYEYENTVTFEYLSTLDTSSVVKGIEIENDDYSIDRVQDAVREILIMDKQPKFSSLDSIRKAEMLV